MDGVKWGLVAIVGILLAITAYSPSEPPHDIVKAPATRHKAPEFALKDSEGKLVHLSDYKGKVVLLDFWATWCGPCIVEIPWFVQFEKKYKDRGFEVLGVSMDEDGWKAISPFVAKKRMNYQVVLGDLITGEQYGGIRGLPTAFIIDRDGKIAAVEMGLSEKKEFQDAIEKLL